MASHEGSRKKRKMSYADGRTSQPTHTPAVASSSALLSTNPAMNAAKANAPCQHEQTLRALNTDLDAMRQLVTCKICDRLLYEPYALTCGHTYCYSCLSQWLGSNAKMTCPDCRTVIRQQPTPSYLIRELVLVFVSRNELLPDGETADEHNKAVREEAEIVAKDKANTDRRTGGLFKGRFKRSRLHVLGPLRDPGDGVDRCPGCHWELEDGHCNQCGFEADDLDDDFSLDDSDSAHTDDELDQELRDMDEDAFVGADGDPWALDGHLHHEHDEGPLDMGLGHPRFFPVPPRPGPIDLQESSDGDSEDDDYDHNDTFIDDEAIEGSDASDAESDVTAGRDIAGPPRRRNLYGRPAPVVISDDEDEEGIEAPARRYRLSTGVRARPAPIAISDEESEDGNETAPSTVHGADGSESDSEDEEPIIRGSQRNKRPSVAVRWRRAVTVSSSDDSEDGEEPEHDHEHDSISGATEQGGFSPIDDGFGDGVSEQTDHDDDYGGELADGLAAPDFNPYEPDDASAGGYEDDSSRSDDGWGTTTTSRSSRQPLPPLTSRLGTLQQRRARHASSRRTSASTLSPTTTIRPDDPNLRVGGYRFGPPIITRPAPNGFTYASRPAPSTSSHTQQTVRHPFQLDDVLSRINNPPSNYNRRNQQARTYPYQRNVAVGGSHYAGGVQVWPSGSRSDRATNGSSDDASRKRDLSVESDDSQQYYV